MKKRALSLIIILMIPVCSSAWQKGVLISPLRIVFGPKQRFASVKIINPSKTKTTYRIELVSMDININGSQRQSKRPDFYSKQALKMIKFSPKKITLNANGIQTIRLMKRITSDLASGEYRTHLKITPLPPRNAKKEIDSNKKGANINLNFLISSTIPVIIRNGSTFTSVNIESAKLRAKTLWITMNRKGTKSALFDIIVKSNGTIIGRRDRVAFYRPNEKLILPVKIKDLKTKKNLIIRLEHNGEKENFIYDIKKITL